MAAPRIYGDDVRAAIHELVNVEHKSASDAHASLEAQFGQSPSLDRIRDIAKEAALAGRAPILEIDRPGQYARLVDGLVEITDAEIARIRRDKGATDADQLLKLANTVKTLEPLLSSKQANKPQGSEAQTPKTTLGRLRASADTGNAANADPTQAERPLHAQSSAFPTNKVDNGLAA